MGYFVLASGIYNTKGQEYLYATHTKFDPLYVSREYA